MTAQTPNRRETIQDSALLLVEDDRDSRVMFAEFAKDCGFSQVHVACNGEQALEVLRSKPIDLVITDLHMPCVDGVTLIASIRKTTEPYQGRDMGIIAMTADGRKETVIKAIKSGADSYLLKPVSPQAFRERAGLTCQLAHSRRQPADDAFLL